MSRRGRFASIVECGHSALARHIIDVRATAVNTSIEIFTVVLSTPSQKK